MSIIHNLRATHRSNCITQLRFRLHHQLDLCPYLHLTSAAPSQHLRRPIASAQPGSLPRKSAHSPPVPEHRDDIVSYPATEGQLSTQDENEEHESFRGFWSLSSDYQTVLRAEEESQRQAKAFLSQWANPAPTHKPDLSYAKGIRSRWRQSPVAFRAASNSSPQRRITAYLLKYYYVHITAQHGLPDHLARALMQAPDFDLARIHQVLLFSWILHSGPSHGIYRVVLLTSMASKLEPLPVPLWVVLQLLRAPRIEPFALHQLTRMLLKTSDSWTWTSETPIILCIRLLRHARRSDAALFPSIVALFIKLLDVAFPPASSSPHSGPAGPPLHKKINWCHTMLRLLALPANDSPFRVMRHQQQAQLDLLAYMHHHQPQLPVQRHGFRAVAGLQLMHERTATEAEWARAQSPTWPPWEDQNRMGLFALPKNLPGRRSRLIKVLDRMQQAGYALYDYDLALQVLAGWDTDGSPTVQVRRRSSALSIAMPWLRGLDSSSAGTGSSHIWAARVEATRSVREAWMSFCSFREQVPNNKDKAFQRVYHAMLTKLISRELPQSTALNDRSLPGDGLEVHQDPDLPRHRVFIPNQVPTPNEFFAAMKADGVLISQEIVGEMLELESDFDAIHSCLAVADLSEEAKFVLLNPFKLSSHAVAATLNELRPRFVVAYTNLLARPSVHNVSRKSKVRTKGLDLARRILKHLKHVRYPAWQGYLHALLLYTHESRHDIHMVHNRLVIAFMHIQRYASVNFVGFSTIASCAFRLQTAKVELNTLGQPCPLDIVKGAFMLAALGKQTYTPADWNYLNRGAKAQVLSSVPRGRTLEEMVWALGVGQQKSLVDDVIILLEWFKSHKDDLANSKQHVTKENIACVRIFLEGSWMDEELSELGVQARTAVPGQLKKARSACQHFADWADDSDVQAYMLRMHPRFQRLKESIKAKYANAQDKKAIEANEAPNEV